MKVIKLQLLRNMPVRLARHNPDLESEGETSDSGASGAGRNATGNSIVDLDDPDAAGAER